MKKFNPSNSGGAVSGSRGVAMKQALNPAMIAGGRAQPGAPVRSPAKSVPAGRGQGNGHGQGSKAVKPAMVKASAPKRRATARVSAAAVAQPHYDTGLRYDTPGLRYAAEDPVPPTPPTGAKVTLDLASRTDPSLAAFAEAHKEAMTGNTFFPTPVPSAADFDYFLADFEAYLAKMEALKVEMKNLTEQKDRSRAALCAAFTQRAQYVEMASNGDPDILATTALPLRKSPTPVGQLPWPQNLKVEQSQSVGELIVKWMAVSKARGYLLQCAEVVEGESRVWQNVYTGGKNTSAQKPLTPGKTYEFRIAALGGSTGQSDWSPVVSRMAA